MVREIFRRDRMFLADLLYYRISVVTVKVPVLTIPAAFYMEWIQNDAEALYSRTKVNMRRLITQTTGMRDDILF